MLTPQVPSAIAAQLAAACAVLERHLGGTLRSIHLFGSAVDGGLKPHSDIDLFVTVTMPPTESVRRALMLDLLAVSAWPGAGATLRPLEATIVAQGAIVPWRYPARRELQFGEWLREELAAGVFEPPIFDHDLAILLTKVRQHSVPVLGPPADELFDPVPHADFARALADTIAQWNDDADWQGDEGHIALALARIWYSVCTGAIASKDAAAAWALERLPPAPRPVLETARQAYLTGAGDDLAARGEEFRAFVLRMKAEIDGALGGHRR